MTGALKTEYDIRNDKILGIVMKNNLTCDQIC